MNYTKAAIFISFIVVVLTSCAKDKTDLPPEITNFRFGGVETDEASFELDLSGQMVIAYTGRDDGHITWNELSGTINGDTSLFFYVIRPFETAENPIHNSSVFTNMQSYPLENGSWYFFEDGDVMNFNIVLRDNAGQETIRNFDVRLRQ